MSSVDDLFAFLSASPSPYHAVEEASRRLLAAGFAPLEPSGAWPAAAGTYFVAHGGALVAWSVADRAATEPHTPFRIVGAHTDSPNLRIKPQPDTGGFGWRQLSTEVYGGALWNSWLDRDLGLSGRVTTTDGRTHLFHADRPLLRVPQLAIHLDRDVNGQGLKLNPQQHLTPIWGTGGARTGDFRRFLVEQLRAEHPDHTYDVEDVTAWDAMTHDLTPPALIGQDQDLVASGRIDNLLSCWAALAAVTDPVAGSGDAAVVAVVCLYDHEEVGSQSATGADGALLAHVLERSVLARGGARDDLLRAFAGSVCASADCAHATHPNYPERHDPGHHVVVNGGPVVKVNANQRYATDAATASVLIEACDRAGSPHQWFVSRNDQPCGSTIGPVTSARLGISTFDVGVAQLSMHSARELCGATDAERFPTVLAHFLAG